MTTGRINFSAQSAHVRPIRRVPDKYLDSALRPRFDIADGIRPTNVYVPHRSLPVRFQDKTTTQYVVIPKGRLVSAITMLNNASDVFTGTYEGGATKELGPNVWPGSDGDITLEVGRTIFIKIPTCTTPGDATLIINGITYDDGNAGGGVIDATGGVYVEVVIADAEATIVVGGGPTDKELRYSGGALPIKLGQDASYFGVNRNTLGLIVPANGGAAATYVYGADDVSALVPMTGDPARVVLASDTITIAANAPIGAVWYDVYQDIRGQYINYDPIKKNYGVLASQEVIVPFVDVYILETASALDKTTLMPKGMSYEDSGDQTAAATGAGYVAAEKYFSFLTIDSEQAAQGQSGTFVAPDIFGNYVAQYDTLTNNYRTIQTAGRILGLDSRLSKDLLDTVMAARFETNRDSGRVAGTQTEGLPEHLYYFAEKMLTGAGYVWPTDGTDPAKKIRSFVEAGAFGYAYIQLSTR